MTHTSRKAWKAIKELPNDPGTSTPLCLVSATQVAHQLLVIGRGNISSKRRVLPSAKEGNAAMVHPFGEEEDRKAVEVLKNNNPAGRDYVLVVKLNTHGPKAHMWLLTMLNKCFMENKIPTTWIQYKIIAILKPGKESAIPKSYHPMSMSHVRTQRKNEIERNSTNHRTPPN